MSRVELLEPMGARSLDAPLTFGGVGAGVVLPGAAEGVCLQLEFAANGWWVFAPTGRAALLNAQKLTGTTAANGRELLPGDVIEIGAARIVVVHAAPLQLDVRHLAGNETVAPLTVNRSRVDADGDEDIDIVAATLESGARSVRSDSSLSESLQSRSRLWPAVTIVLVALLALVLWMLGQVVRVPVDVDPREASVSVDGIASWHSSGTLFAMPGERTVRASLEGYEDVAKALTIATAVAGAPPARISLQLVRKPGIVIVDTGGVAAEATVDGAPLGPVPGELKIPAGTRTLTLRAERYLDLVQTLDVQGGGVRQDLKVAMQTSWGKLAVSATVADATLSVDARAPVALPATLDLPAGVHRMRIAAPSARDWESSVLVRAGQVQRVGPVTLGAPDARIVVRSQPSGADVTIAGEFRGRTPLQLALPSGTSYDVLVTRAGYRTWTRSVAAEAGQGSTLEARLEPVFVALTVRGVVADAAQDTAQDAAKDAEVFIDGSSRGRAPLTVNALAMRQRVEVRKSGMQTFVADVDLTPALARTIEFTLVPEGRGADWRPPALSANAKVGIPLRLIPIGSFSMGSERREQGRRPNEVLRRVTFMRPFYLSTREVTNADFRRFRRDHASGVVDGRTIDLDAQAVTGVTWQDAVEYCNWLSLQEGLAPAYEQQGGRWALKAPVGTGYRLPSEAEWEYAARYAPGGLRRYGWGDALPVPPDFANLGGAEVRAALPGVLEGYTDSHPGVAPTGKYAASPLGLVDMTGNVSEWVHDWYASSPDSAAATDPFGPASGARHVVKGSNWRTISFAELRLAWREGADGATQDIGFRVARYAE